MNPITQAILPALLTALISPVYSNPEPFENLKKAVVKITAKAEGEQTKVGTGFIVKLEGNSVYLATASHVVEGDSHPFIEFYTQPNKLVAARVIRLEGGNPRGLALLRVEGELPTGLSTLDLDASSQIHGGEPLTIIGFPRIVGTPWAITQGSIAGLSGRDLTFTGATDEGNSGGPLIREGKVIGLITEITGPFGYAIPANTLAFALQGWGIQLGATNQITPAETPSINTLPDGSKLSAPAEPVLKKTNELLTMARLQGESGDYVGAWEMINQAIKLTPDSSDVQNAQPQLAMAWIRNIRVPDGQTFTGIVDKLLPCLYRTAAVGSGVQAADSWAHIGYANFLKQRDGVFGLKIEENFRQALKLDAENVYAHSMWGFWILWQAGKLDEANPHFSAALKSGRDREFVRELQVAGLRNVGDSDYALQLIRVMDDMRKNSENLSLEERRRVETHVYFMYRKEVLERLSVLPPADHLATYRWLIQDFTNNDWRRRFFVARLTEAAGDLQEALSLYRSIQAYSEFKSFTLKSEVEAGIQRCEHQPK
jgi:tetratricopeptide (TPR) repeat protein